MKYTITGATGHLGRLVVQAMLQLVAPNEIRAAVHTPAKAAHLMAQGLEVVTADYLDVSLMKTALVGTDVLIYIPSKTYDLVQRVTELENTLAAMQQAQVKKIIFVSFFADQANNPFRMSAYYGYVPRRLAASEFDYAIVKNALYADPLVPYLPELIQRHNIIYPVGQQPLAFITQQDSAAAIAKLAVQPQLRDHGQTYLLSQTQNYTMPQLAEKSKKELIKRGMTLIEYDNKAFSQFRTSVKPQWDSIRKIAGNQVVDMMVKELNANSKKK